MKTVLVVDDSPTIRQQASFILNKEGYEVIEAEDGEKGIETLKNNKDLALIISDINMPNMNGLDMLKKIRELKEFDHIPIFMLTTESDPSKIKIAQENGANGWMVKPFDPKTLVKILADFAA